MEFERPPLERIAFTTPDHLLFTDKDKIVCFESGNNSTKVFLSTGEKITISKTLKEVEKFLRDPNFIRTHASFLVNIRHVNKLTRGDKGYIVMSNNQRVAISRKRKNDFLELFSKL